MVADHVHLIDGQDRRFPRALLPGINATADETFLFRVE